jgi:pimeloyl-ACP methyl ester carboxylesterase
MATLELGTTRIGYATEGADDASGDPILLFHGTTMDRTAWDMVRAAMPTSRRYVMVEFPGSGESSMPDEPLTVEGLVTQATAVMDHLGHERFHVAGYSLGAVVALATSAHAGDRVRSVTSLCGWAVTDARMRFTFGLWKQLIATDPALFMRYAVADGFTANAIAGLEPMLEGVVAMGATALAPGSAAHLDLDAVVDITGLLGTISCPTLVIAGGEDRWVDPSHSRQIASAVPGARLEVLPAGHLVIQELAADVAALLDAHIAST